jgi:glutathionylspermidine synthase
MKITKEIMAVHRELSDTSAAFLEFVEKNPGASERSQYRSLKWHDERVKLQPWPTFINQKKKKEMATASIRVCNLIKNLLQRLFDSEPGKISHYYEIPADLVKMQLNATNKEHIARLLARGDFIFSPSGIKCIEYNISSDLSGLETPIWQSMYSKVPLISRFLEENHVKIKNNNLLSFLLKYLAGIGRAKWPSRAEINISFVIQDYTEGQWDREEVYLNQLYKDILAVGNKSLKGQIIFCDYHQLNTSNNGVFHREKQIHILVEFYSGMVMPEILNCFKNGDILVYNGPITRLLSNKLNLALLSENRDSAIFSDEERQIIKKYIPWTRKLTVGDTTYDGARIKLKDFVFSNREKLVIKPSENYGGIGVCIGKNTPDSQWRENVTQAIMQKGWLVQEYVQSLPYLYQSGENGCTVCIWFPICRLMGPCSPYKR